MKLNSYLRDKFLRDGQNFETNALLESQDILDIYRDFNLNPTMAWPIELKRGLPHNRENLTIFFRNADFNDCFIEEPGSVSYWRDFIYKDVWLRAGFQSNTFNLWYMAFNDQHFHMNYLFYDWLIFARGLIKPMLSIMDSPQFNALGVQAVSGVKSFSEVQIRKDVLAGATPNGLFVPSLIYETQLAEEVGKANTSFFESAPAGLEELIALYDYARAKNAVQIGNYPAATKLLMEAKRVLKKFHHTHGQVKLLLKLYAVAYTQEKLPEAMGYLQEALELCKTGKIPIEDMIQIHISMAWIHGLQKQPKEMDRQMEIALKFLNSLPSTEENQNLFPKIHLEWARIRMHLQDYNGANEAFKELFKYIKLSPLYEFFYYYERSNYYAAINSEQKQMLALQKAVSLKDLPQLEGYKARLQMGKMLLYTKQDPKQALEYLTKAEKMITDEDMESLKLRIQVYEMLNDANMAIHNDFAAKMAKQEIGVLQEKLDHLH